MYLNEFKNFDLDNGTVLGKLSKACKLLARFNDPTTVKGVFMFCVF